MENMLSQIDIIKQQVMTRLIDEGYVMTNTQWSKLSNMPFMMTLLNDQHIKDPENFVYRYLKHYIETFGLPNEDDIKVMSDIELLFNKTFGNK